MIKNDQAVIEANLAVGYFQVIYGVAGYPLFNEAFQIVSPESEASTDWKREVKFIENLVARHQAVENGPWISELP